MNCASCQTRPKVSSNSYCAPCKRAYDQAYRAKNRERLSTQRKENRLLAAYGITLGEYENMVQAQGGICALCNEEPRPNGRLGPALVIDHDHETGQVRGLLCHHCNVALGHLRDDSDLLRKAIKYLEGSNGQEG